MSATALTLDCASEVDTLALGERIGRALVPGDLLSLSGVLGAGKTVLVRGMALGAGIPEGAVRSPTFVLHHVYRGERLVLHHIDLYRLGPAADLTLLDLDTLLEQGAVAVEWGELGSLARYSPVSVQIDTADPAVRRISVTAEHLPPRLAQAWAPA